MLGDLNAVEGPDRRLIHEFYSLGFPSELDRYVDGCKDALDLFFSKRYTIAFCGGFNTGKSTVINAFLQHHLLPVGPGSTTGVCTRLYHSPYPTAYIRSSSDQTRIVTHAQAVEYIAILEKNLESVKTTAVREIGIGLDDPLFENDLEILDTPGLLDGRQLTEAALMQMERADAVVFLYDPLRFMSQYELELTERLLTTHPRTFFPVLNRYDKVREDQQKDIEEQMEYYFHNRVKCWIIAALYPDRFEMQRFICELKDFIANPFSDAFPVRLLRVHTALELLKEQCHSQELESAIAYHPSAPDLFPSPDKGYRKLVEITEHVGSLRKTRLK